MSAMYYLSRGGAPEGPFEEARLVQMIQSGELIEGGVCPVGQNQWLALSAFPVFAQALAVRAAPALGYGAAHGAQPPAPTAPGYRPGPAGAYCGPQPVGAHA